MHFRGCPLGAFGASGAKSQWKKIHKAVRHDYKRGL